MEPTTDAAQSVPPSAGEVAETISAPADEEEEVGEEEEEEEDMDDGEDSEDVSRRWHT